MFLCHATFSVLDTAAGVWCDTKSVVTTPRTGRYSADAAGGDASVELTRRCRHAAAAVGDLIFVYGGLRGGNHSSLMAHIISTIMYNTAPLPHPPTTHTFFFAMWLLCSFTEHVLFLF